MWFGLAFRNRLLSSELVCPLLSYMISLLSKRDFETVMSLLLKFFLRLLLINWILPYSSRSFLGHLSCHVWNLCCSLRSEGNVSGKHLSSLPWGNTRRLQWSDPRCASSVCLRWIPCFWNHNQGLIGSGRAPKTISSGRFGKTSIQMHVEAPGWQYFPLHICVWSPPLGLCRSCLCQTYWEARGPAAGRYNMAQHALSGRSSLHTLEAHEPSLRGLPYPLLHGHEQSDNLCWLHDCLGYIVLLFVLD